MTSGPQQWLQWLQGWVLKQSTHNQLHQATPMQVPTVSGVGGVLLGNVLALRTLRLVDLIFVSVC